LQQRQPFVKRSDQDRRAMLQGSLDGHRLRAVPQISKTFSLPSDCRSEQSQSMRGSCVNGPDRSLPARHCPIDRPLGDKCLEAARCLAGKSGEGGRPVSESRQIVDRVFLNMTRPFRTGRGGARSTVARDGSLPRPRSTFDSGLAQNPRELQLIAGSPGHHPLSEGPRCGR
jgi:hypothetical protein